jgi:hypothetical protein
MLASEQRPITKPKQLTLKQREIFDTLFSPGSSMLLLEYQLVLACHTDLEVRERIATFYAQTYIASIKGVLLTAGNKNLPKRDIAAVLRAKENGETVPVCLQRVFQGFDFPVIANQPRFWTFLTDYLKGVLLAHPDLTILKTAFYYVIEAGVANRMTAEDVREYGLGIRQKSLALSWLRMYATVANELAPLSLPPGALNVDALKHYGMMFCAKYALVSMSAHRMLALLQVLVSWMCSPLIFFLVLGIAHYNNVLTPQNAVALFFGMFCVSLLAAKCLPSLHSVNNPQAVATNLARLSALFKFVPIKFIHEGTIVRAHEIAVATQSASVIPDLSAAYTLSQRNVVPSVFSAVDSGIAETSIVVEPAAPVGGNIHVPKPIRRQQKPATDAAIPAAFASTNSAVVLVDAVRNFYARIDVEALREQGVSPFVIKTFIQALKPDMGLLPANSQGHAGVKLIDPKKPVRRRGEVMTAKLKIVGASAHGARLFSRLAVDGIHVFDTFVDGNRAHRF